MFQAQITHRAYFTVREAALAAKSAGATRFCMGAAWRAPIDRDVEAVSELVRAVKATGLESCAMLGEGHTEALRDHPVARN